ncbi:MAG: TIGR01620 family protein [Pseudomonadota bacterium]
MNETSGPVVVEVDGPTTSPAVAPQPEKALPRGQPMETVIRLGARPASALSRWFWGSLGALIIFAASIAIWDFATGLLARNAALGWASVALISVFGFCLLLVCLREIASLVRLRRIDELRGQAERTQGGDIANARALVASLKLFYGDRPDTRWAFANLREKAEDSVDADTLLAVTERTLLEALDRRVEAEIEAATRQVATITALVPLALADVAAALFANLRMIRRIAEIYGGRAGTLGAWRLTRTVLGHLAATGLVAVGDDMLSSVAGGSVLSKFTRRFGEGLVNGALTARVGVAAMEVCRPLPFNVLSRPSVSALVGRALSGVFSGGRGPS